MNTINTDHFARCINTLDRAFKTIQTLSKDDDLYDIYRAACIKEFELILEQAGKLLKKKIKPFFANPKQVDELHFKDVFRQAAKYGLIEVEASERWFDYRDHRNDTAHDYGAALADQTLALLAQFIRDAQHINQQLQSS